MNGSKWLWLGILGAVGCGAPKEPPADVLPDPVAEHGPAVALLGSWAVGTSGRLVEVRCVTQSTVAGYLGERAQDGYRRYEARSVIDGLIVEMSSARASYSVTVNLDVVSMQDEWLVANEIPARVEGEAVTLRRLDAVGSVGEDCSTPWDAENPVLQAYSGPARFAAVTRTASTAALTSSSVVR